MTLFAPQVEKLAKWVVVGGDGLVGSHLACLSEKVSSQIILTTRRKDAGGSRLFADLDGGHVADVIAAKADVVFLCAAMTSMQACRENPELSYRINVTGTVDLASQLVKQGAFVVFLSSNTVFNGLTDRPDEHESYTSVTEYGRQKVGAEQQLMAIPGADEHIAIVRLSKIISPYTGIAAEFLRRFQAGESCRAFEYLKMSPISLSYVTNALLTIASHKLPGIFHLSGAEELSYAEFAHRLAAHIGAKPELVMAVSSRNAGVDVLFNPEFPALGMVRTRELLGIEPEPMYQVLDELSSKAK